MYQFTENERTTLKNTMVELLEKYDYEYTNYALDRIIDTWATNKQTLIEAFKKHPNYIDGKFLIAFESDYDRDIDKHECNRFIDWIGRLTRNNEYRDALPDEVKNHPEFEGSWMPERLYWLVNSDLCYYERTINEYLVESINNAIPSLKVHIGEKTTRVVNKICTYLNYHKHPDYNRMYAKYADALTPITIRRHTILSLNPIDYLTMSFGNSWSSCHTIDKTNKRNMPNGYEGQYSSGTMSYMLDSTSMVLYTVDAKYDGNEFYLQDKINRQMFHYGEDKLIQSRLYPQSNDSNKEVYTPYRQIVQEIISTIFDFPNLWVKKSNSISNYVSSWGTHYQDYYHFSNCNLTIKKDSQNELAITIGHDPICIECGEEHCESESINCCRSNTIVCERCGCVVDRDDAYEIDGEYYCEDCVVYCDMCNEYHNVDDCEYVDNYGWICDYCLDEYFVKCEDCGDYVHRDDIIIREVDGWDRELCESCADDYIQCAECGEWVHEDDVNVYGGKHYCDSCFDELFEVCDECREIYPKDDMNDIVDNYGNSHRVCETCFDKLVEEYERIAIENEKLLDGEEF